MASIPEIDFRFDNQRTGLPGLRGLHLRLNLINGANGHGLRNGDAGGKMLTAKGTDNRHIADGNIAPLLLPLSEDALNPFQCAAD